MNALETRVPPPLAGLICGALAWLASVAVGNPAAIAFPIRLTAALALLVLGFSITLAGVRTVLRAKTTLNPIKPETSSALVTSGIYGYTRNPMYLGMGTWLLAWSAWLGTPVGLLGAPLFMLYMNRFQIGPEERALSTLFGAEFAAYRTRVRRWL
jgi:protein-S-isoprenylcysteine O-methyltransferase Ste14